MASEDHFISNIAARLITQRNLSRDDLLDERHILDQILSKDQKIQLFACIAQGYHSFCLDLEKLLATSSETDLVSSQRVHWERLVEIFYFFDDHSIRGTINYCNKYLEK